MRLSNGEKGTSWTAYTDASRCTANATLRRQYRTLESRSLEEAIERLKREKDALANELQKQHTQVQHQMRSLEGRLQAPGNRPQSSRKSNQIAIFQPSVQALDTEEEPFEKLESSGDGMFYDSIPPCPSSDSFLSETNASSEETDAKLLQPSSSPCPGDTYSSLRTAERTSHAANHPTDSRSKVSEIDMNECRAHWYRGQHLPCLKVQMMCSGNSSLRRRRVLMMCSKSSSKEKIQMANAKRKKRVGERTTTHG